MAILKQFSLQQRDQSFLTGVWGTPLLQICSVAVQRASVSCLLCVCVFAEQLQTA